MTNDKLKASRELDTLVAEKVFGFKVRTFHDFGNITLRYINPRDPSLGHWCELPYFSIAMTAAWNIVEMLKSYRWSITLDIDFATGYSVRLLKCLIPIDDSPEIYVEAKTMPLAICQAALEAVKYDKR
jgi:hypothetical protein